MAVRQDLVVSRLVSCPFENDDCVLENFLTGVWFYGILYGEISRFASLYDLSSLGADLTYSIAIVVYRTGRS